MFTMVAAVLAVAAGGEDQRLVLFYAVAVFVSFLAGLIAMARLTFRDGRRVGLAVNVVAATAVGFTLVVNLLRGAPVVSVVATLLIAAVLYRLWVRSGRPGGVGDVCCQCHAARVAPRRA